MGNNNQPNKNLPKLIWLDQRVNNSENSYYQKNLIGLKKYEIYAYTKTKDCIEKLKQLKFVKTYIIISGSISKEFFAELEKIINIIRVCPVIMIFTSESKMNLIKANIISLDKFSFFNINYVYCSFEEVQNRLISQDIYHFHKIENPNVYEEYNNYFSFEYINESKDLIFPLTFKEFLEMPCKTEIKIFNEYLLNRYSKFNDMKKLIQQLLLETEVPLNVLVKYWIRAYTLDTLFYKEMNFSLEKKAGNSFDPFIRVLYQGLLKNVINNFNENTLYRGALIKIKEIEYIKTSLNKKKEGLPGCICYNKAFLSSSLDKEVAISFMTFKNPKDNEERVLYIFKKGENIDEENATNADIQPFSFFEKEREILFFPYSTFEITEISKKKIQLKDRTINYCEVYLNYLGKYKKKIDKSQKIPENSFTKIILSTNVLEKLDMNKDSNKKKFEFKIDKYIPEELKISYIIAMYNITDNDINKKIQLINCEEKINKFELEKKCEIYFDEKKIDFTYEYIFINPGKYTFTFKFNSLLENANKLFCCCDHLISLNFEKFKSNYIKDMADMFNGCNKLETLDLSSFKTKDVISMERIFKGCNNLKMLDISSFNTNIVENMSEMFSDCTSLTYLDLSNFQTNNVKEMFRMFYNCNSLSFVSLSNFKLNNAKNINEMFSKCSSLRGLNFDLSILEIKDDIITDNIFNNCNNLKNISGLKMPSFKTIFNKIIEFIKENMIKIYQKNENELRYFNGPKNIDEARNKYLRNLFMYDDSLYYLLKNEKSFNNILNIFEYNLESKKLLFEILINEYYLFFLSNNIKKSKNKNNNIEENDKFLVKENLHNNIKFLNLIVEVRNKIIDSLSKEHNKITNNIFKISSIINWVENYSEEITSILQIFSKLNKKIADLFDQIEKMISSNQIKYEGSELNQEYTEIINKVFFLCIDSILSIITTKEEVYNLSLEDLIYLINTFKEILQKVLQLEVDLNIRVKEVSTFKEISKLYDALYLNNLVNIENIKKIIHYFKEEKICLNNDIDEQLNTNFDKFYIYLVNIMGNIPPNEKFDFNKFLSSLLFDEFTKIKNPNFKMNILNKILKQNNLIKNSSQIITIIIEDSGVNSIPHNFESNFKNIQTKNSKILEIINNTKNAFLEEVIMNIFERKVLKYFELIPNLDDKELETSYNLYYDQKKSIKVPNKGYVIFNKSFTIFQEQLNF